MTMIIKKIFILLFVLILASADILSRPKPKDVEKFDYIQYAGLSLGLSSEAKDDLYFFSIMGDYELQFEKSKGIGGFLQFSVGKKSEILFGIPIYFHHFIYKDITFQFGPGINYTDNFKYVNPYNSAYGSFDTTSPYPNPYKRMNFFLRVGGNWNFYYTIEPNHKIIIMPTIYFDFLNMTKTYFFLGCKVNYIFEKKKEED